LGTSAEFWMNLQASYDLEEAARLIAPALRELHPIAA
jgi:plasmid maintenance system antidote protein VapI